MRKIISSVIAFVMLVMALPVMPAFADETGTDQENKKYTEPESPAITYNMNVDWKFTKASGGPYLAAASASVVKNGKQFYEVDYDDSAWQDVSVPHPINAEDTFDGNAYDKGENSLFRGFMFYRKHVTIPATDAGKKMFLEFEAVRQSVYLYVNGVMVGYYEAGIAPIGFDITDYVNAGEDNVIAVATDNSASRGNNNDTKETRPGSVPGAADGAGYQWNTQDFNEVQGGITGNVNLYVKGKIYQTLPLYNNLKTTGNYIYGSKYDIDAKSATINVEAEVRNETEADADLTLQVDVVDMDGNLAYTYETTAETTVKKATDANASAKITANEDIDDATLIFASYNGSKLAGLSISEDTVSIDKDETEAFLIPGSVASAGDTKAMIWDSVEGMKPADIDVEYTEGAHYMNMVPADAYDANPDPTDISTVDVSYINASFEAKDMRFWSDKDPYLYTVYTILKDGDEIIDVQKKDTGFRKVEYNINDGLLINDKSVYLKGYAQRSTDEWAVIGVANDWLNDIDMGLIRESNANHIRWMHVAPKPVEVRSSDKYGVIVVCPAGDKEGDADGRSWDQRVEAMRDAMIYFRNNPSVMFWEAGNNAVSAEHMQEITDLRLALDPNGGRFAGSRTISSVDQIKAAEYVGTMLNRNASSAKSSMTAANGKYMPILETEYARDEAPRRVWDDYSPPDYDYKNRFLDGSVNKKDGYDVWDQTSEDFSRFNAGAYNEFWAGRVGGGGSELYAGAAIMVWSDSNMHTRNTYSENCRTSGKVDPVRIKKDAFYTLQTVQSDEPAVHIIGHWNYPSYKKDDTKNGNYWYEDRKWVDGDPGHFEPNGQMLQRDPTKKSVYVIGSPDIVKVELYINDVLKETNVKPSNNFVYEFKNIDVSQASTKIDDRVEKGLKNKISVIAYNESDLPVAEDEIETAGAPAAIRLTPVTGPDGLVADGSDIAYFDVEVVDEDGQVCPLDYSRLDLELSGDGVLLGGYNSGVGDKITTHKVENNKGYTNAECGVNRVFVRSTRKDGKITLKVSHDKLGSFESTIESIPYDNTVGDNVGLSTTMQRSYGLGAQPPVVEEKVVPYRPLAKEVKADFDEETGNTKVVEAVDNTVYYTVKVGDTTLDLTGEVRAREGSETNTVFGPIKPVIEKLQELGAVTNASVEGSPAVLTFTVGEKTYTVTENYNEIVDEEGTRTEITETAFVFGGELFVNYNAVLSYISGVTVALSTEDDENICTITYTPVETASLSDGIELFAADGIVPMAIDPAYETNVLTENYSTSGNANDGPDGSKCLKVTSTTNVFNGQGTTLQKESRISLDFRFDDASATMAFRGSNWGPNISLDGTTFRTQTGQTAWQTLATGVEKGQWYRMVIEGTMAVANAYATCTVYDLSDYSNPKEIGVTPGMNLRNLAGTGNGTADRLEVNAGLSVDNLSIDLLYADTIDVTALKSEIKANESLTISAAAKRGEKTVATPELDWELLTADGNALTDKTITFENGILSTKVNTGTQDIILKATAQTPGNAYGELRIHIDGIDTSNDEFNDIVISSDQDYVCVGEPATITAELTMDGNPVTPEDFVKSEEVVWSVYNAANVMEINNIGITVEDGVVSVSEDVLPQTINVKASNKSGSAFATVKLDVLPYEYGGDTFVNGNACEEIGFAEGAELKTGSWDGSGYYSITSATCFDGFGANTGDHVLYSADIRFKADGAGWKIWGKHGSSDHGKQGLEVNYNKGKIAVRRDSNNNPTFCSAELNKWYNVQIMCATGVSPNSYAYLVVYAYDENGNKVNPEDPTSRDPYVKRIDDMRNLSGSQANHMEIQPNTDVDNVYYLRVAPDDITVTFEKSTMFAGQTLQGKATAYRKGVPFGFVTSEMIRWVVYDENDESVINPERLVTVDQAGRLTADALADAQTVHVHAQTLDGSLFDSVPIEIKSADIFNVHEIGFNEDYTEVVQLDVTKDFSYSDDVTFMVAVYDKATGGLVSASTRKMSAKGIARSTEEAEVIVPIPMSAPMPEDFDKDNPDAKYEIWVYTMTSNSEIEAVTEDDGTIEAAFAGNALNFTTLPEFDEASPVILMVVKPETVTTSVKDEDIVYIKQFTGATLSELTSVAIPADAEAGDYIIKVAGRVGGVSEIHTGVVTK